METIDRLSIIWKLDLANKIKWDFFQAVVVLMHHMMLTKSQEKSWPRMPRVILNKSRKQHPMKQQLYGPLLPISMTIKRRWSRHAGHCWRSNDEIKSDVLQWAPSHERAFIGQPTRTYRQQLFSNTGSCLEDMTRLMDNNYLSLPPTR